MGITHLQSLTELVLRGGAQERVGGKEGTHFGVRQMEFHSMFYVVHFAMHLVVFPTVLFVLLLKRQQTKLSLMFLHRAAIGSFPCTKMHHLSPGVQLEHHTKSVTFCHNEVDAHTD